MACGDLARVPNQLSPPASDELRSAVGLSGGQDSIQNRSAAPFSYARLVGGGGKGRANGIAFRSRGRTGGRGILQQVNEFLNAKA